MAFMQQKEVENVINLYQTETSFWDTNDKLTMTLINVSRL